MGSIFLSHNHKDKDFVHRIGKDLVNSSIEVWIDDAEMNIGDSLLKKIADGINKVKYVGAVISVNSINSSWVQRELEIAMTREINQSKVVVLPLVIDNTSIPTYLAGKLYADFRDPRNYKSELNKLLKLLLGNNYNHDTAEFEVDFDLEDILQSKFIKLPSGHGTLQLLDIDPQVNLNYFVNSFCIDKHLVTQSLFSLIMHFNPSYFLGDNLPVEMVYWKDALNFCNLLSQKTGRSKCYQFTKDSVHWNQHSNGYRLPTEFEWDYACKGKTTDPMSLKIDDIAWYRNNSNQRTHVVGTKLPNTWGIYDMLGNVWEWIWEPFNIYRDLTIPMVHHFKSDDEYHNVIRGGSWSRFARDCQPSIRDLYSTKDCGNAIGFRVCRNSDPFPDLPS